MMNKYSKSVYRSKIALNRLSYISMRGIENIALLAGFWFENANVKTKNKKHWNGIVNNRNDILLEGKEKPHHNQVNSIQKDPKIV